MSIELVKNALRSETFHGTPPVLLKDNQLNLERLNYGTLNEYQILTQLIHRYQRKVLIEHTLINIGIGVLTGAALGAISHFPHKPHGFDSNFWTDDRHAIIKGGEIGLVAGGFATKALNIFDQEDLNKLEASWLGDENSYLFHEKSHRYATHRLLTIDLSSSSKKPQVRFGVLFQDEYIGYLCPLSSSPLKKHLDQKKLEYRGDCFAMSGQGESTGWVKTKTELGSLTAANDLDYPIELWSNAKSKCLAVIKYEKTHTNIY